MDKSRTTWSKRHGGDLRSVKEFRVEPFAKLNNGYETWRRAKIKDVSSSTDPSIQAIPVATAPPDSTRKTPLVPRSPTKKLRGLQGSRFATPSAPSISTVRDVDKGPGAFKLPSTLSYSTSPQNSGLGGSNVRMAASHTLTTTPQNPSEQGPGTSTVKKSTGPRGALPSAPRANLPGEKLTGQPLGSTGQQLSEQHRYTHQMAPAVVPDVEAATLGVAAVAAVMGLARGTIIDRLELTLL